MESKRIGLRSMPQERRRQSSGPIPAGILRADSQNAVAPSMAYPSK
jgi:hypothetical protein